MRRADATEAWTHTHDCAADYSKENEFLNEINLTKQSRTARAKTGSGQRRS